MRYSRAMPASDTPESASQTFFREGGNCWAVKPSERFGWCIDGESYFSALRHSLIHAQHEILILGWDIDSRFKLVRDDEEHDHPADLCGFLESLAESNEELEIRILSWDFAVVYALERELMPARAFGWRNSERLHFELDGAHAPGASHHQKVVIVDGEVAYSGGLDLTKCRWDTREHAADDPRRIDPTGEHYPPFHDVQAVVSGDAAQRLRELFRDRWQNATGETLAELEQRGDGAALWPEAVTVQAKESSVAIARTWSGADGNQDIREVETLYLDMIAAAEHAIYIENQYFTSVSISEALAERLDEENGPEIVIVLPAKTSGWLEQATMDVLRNRAIARLQEADRFNRLRILSPTSDDLTDACITVHAKIIVVDNRIARIGSANLSRRSMNLDSECDLAIVDESAALSLCADLLSEHCGADFDEVKASLSGGGLFATIERFGDGARRLLPLDIDSNEIQQAVLEPVAKVADLEQPIVRDTGDSDDAASRMSLTGWLSLGAIGIALAVAAYFALSGSGEDFSLQSLLDALRDVADHPIAPFVVMPAFVLGSLVVAPVIGMIALTALLFDPWVATAAALSGTLAATAVNHWLGSRFHQTLMQKVPDKVTDKIATIASSSDVWTLAGLRLIPIAPFSLVNLVVGASGVPLKTFLLGTLISMTPGIVLICLSVDRARAALQGEPLFDPWIAAGIAVAAAATVGLRLWKNSQKADQD